MIHINCILTIFWSVTAIFYFWKTWQIRNTLIFFKFDHILCSYILPFKYNIIQSAHFPHANTQMYCCNWIQLIAFLATCKFLWTSITVNCIWYKSVYGYQYCISFEAATHWRESDINFFNKYFTEECKLLRLYTVQFWMLNKDKHLKILKPPFCLLDAWP